MKKRVVWIIFAVLAVVLLSTAVVAYTVISRDGVQLWAWLTNERLAAGNRSTFEIEDVGFAMRYAPSGTFPAGVDDQRQAVVNEGFWIGETAVTHALWEQVRVWAVENGYHGIARGWAGNRRPNDDRIPDQDLQPVTYVSWQDCIVWTNALSELLGFQPVYTYQGRVIRAVTDTAALIGVVQEAGNGFRIPTSAEWELAARYQDGASWTAGGWASGAGGPVSDRSVTDRVAWYAANSGGGSWGVGQKEPNALGLFDMSGNVWEWTFTAHGLRRIRHGGAWDCGPDALRVGDSFSANPGFFSGDLGFRLARNAE